MYMNKQIKEALERAGREFRTPFEKHSKEMERRFHDIKRRPEGKKLGEEDYPFFDGFETAVAIGCAVIILIAILLAFNL